jgi:hypothetical protein
MNDIKSTILSWSYGNFNPHSSYCWLQYLGKIKYLYMDNGNVLHTELREILKQNKQNVSGNKQILVAD